MSHTYLVTNRARSLRKAQTKSEKLLWGLVRKRQLCNLKFRRQHPIGPYFADFACVSHRLVVEIDGDYHNYVTALDELREKYINEHGWKVLRVSSSDAEKNTDHVGVLIARLLDLEYSFEHHSKSATREIEFSE